jgi:hypothetical protein
LRFFNLFRGLSLGLLCLPLLAAGPSEALRPLTGSQFARFVEKMDSRQREQAILKELLGGNLPGFLRNLAPVKLSYRPPNGKTVDATIFVMPEYLAIGSDQDFLRIPMNLYTASAVASRMGFILPTRKMVNAIYEQSAFHFSPEPMTAGPQMRSTEYYRIHNEKIEEQARMLGVTSGALVSGHKKDVVLTNLLAGNPGRIAIYGWHRLSGLPIQPLSTVHGACYADYSHGIRLVSETALVDGKAMSVYEMLQDAALSRVLSDEGPIPHARELIARTEGDSTCGEIKAPKYESATAIPHFPF